MKDDMLMLRNPNALFDLLNELNAQAAKQYGALPIPVGPERDEPFPGESDLSEEEE